MSDRIFGGFGLALALFYIWAASIIKDSFMVDVIGPRAFPYIVGSVLAITSIYFILRPDDEPEWPAARDLLEILAATVVMFLYAWFLSDLGFILCTTFATAYLTWRLGTAPLWSLVVGVLTAVGIYVVFHLLLGLALAEGPLGF
ncbi:tripartite tricarboxylate transporter TctB family protein [Pseudoruegeria sp. SHC-113]|uniref:tripartite tricarboxylate transporter TctB family protein n=1 Tax=Pseudoruegeria sp. SHC-113 TaxID=2855439 RepID=UPI0021BAC4D6|nr:tripartite tricarboxylate transporter TctB family protein [Pseudoruegeria sp. SHC-113]MCT8161621.1 tripartite tricarboxylate transporter TctB family protein [Pseudoruegeria sp. SHC-113]